MRVINYIWTRTSTRNWLSHTLAVKRGCFVFEFDWFTFQLVCTKSNNSFYHFDINFIDRYILYFFNGSVCLIKPNKFLIASDFAFSYCSAIVKDNVLQSTCRSITVRVSLTLVKLTSHWARIFVRYLFINYLILNKNENRSSMRRRTFFV